ncbi:phosphotransferase [Actinopolymorpha alba]|uniref:phosphotransferase n=1 Tax=Actinopolymorpha alba TaxID=533267 RepID=UPI000374815F|nr:phosphotransferase [Actinopolymorpha alba]
MARFASGLVRSLRTQWIPALRLPCQVVHGDINLANIGRTPDGETVYLDFGCAANRPRIHDLAAALFYAVVGPGDQGAPEEFAWDRLPELISTYEEASRSRLTPVERQALGPYLAAVPLSVAARAGYLPDPTVLRYRERRAGLRISEWVLANQRAVAGETGATHFSAK